MMRTSVRCKVALEEDLFLGAMKVDLREREGQRQTKKK